MLVTLSLALLGASQVTASQKCYGLALEGGGSRGAYEVGVLSALTSNLPANATLWNIITGVSTGGLNTGGFSQFPYGQEKAAAQFLVDVWTNLTGDNDIYKDWPLGKAQGLLFEAGVYTNSPLKKLVKQLLKTSPQRNITIGSTDLDAGKFHRFTETFPLTSEAVVASSSAPYVFPTTHINGTTYSDGGDTINLDLFSAIERCEEVVADDSDIVIDMVILQPGRLDPVYLNETWTTSDVNQRVKDIKAYYRQQWYLLSVQAAHPDVQYRYVIYPAQKLPGGLIPLNFTPSNIAEQMQLGYDDAVSAINGESAYKTEFFRSTQPSRRRFTE
jgi:hypothetical protein